MLLVLKSYDMDCLRLSLSISYNKSVIRGLLQSLAPPKSHKNFFGKNNLTQALLAQDNGMFPSGRQRDPPSEQLKGVYSHPFLRNSTASLVRVWHSTASH